VQYPSIHPTSCKSSPKRTIDRKTKTMADEINYDPIDPKNAGGVICFSLGL